MTREFFYSALFMLSFTLILSSCSSDDDDNSPSNNIQQIAQIENDVASGTWQITNFIDSGQDETSDFTGYNFTFNTNGTLLATDGSNTLNGTWSITNDDSDDDSDDDDNDIDFNIAFPVTDSSDFEDLNEDWDIVTVTSSVIQLRDDGDGNGDVDELTFEKN